MEFVMSLLENEQLRVLLLGAAASFIYGQIKQHAPKLQRLGDWGQRLVLTVLTLAIVQALQAVGVAVTDAGDVASWGESTIYAILAALYGHAVHHLKPKAPGTAPDVDPPTPTPTEPPTGAV